MHNAMLVFINAAHTIGALLLEDVRLPEVRTSVRRGLSISQKTPTYMVKGTYSYRHT